MCSQHSYIISIILLWLFTISGIIGIFIGYKNWFLPLTSLNLGIYIILLLWNTSGKKTMIALCIPLCIGWLVEFLGVHYGWIFGSYQYGDNLGYKVCDVPLMIGVNWAILTYCTAAMAKAISHSIWVTVILASLLMVGLDVIIEVSAPKFDFWEFKNGIVPIQNYIGWFGTAFVVQWLFQKISSSFHLGMAIHVFMAISVFFLTFLVFWS